MLELCRSRYIWRLILWGLVVLFVLTMSSEQVFVLINDTRPNNSSAEGASKLVPAINNSPVFSEDTLVQDVRRQMPNLPLADGDFYKRATSYYKNKTCAKYPGILDLEFNNLYWQVLHTSNGTFQLYNAYYDKRKLNKFEPIVRILGMIDREHPTVNTFCQLWFPFRKTAVLTDANTYQYIWNKLWGVFSEGTYQPYLISCNIPPKYKTLVPLSVSIVENECDNATNNLRVIYRTPKEKNDFAVCVKGLDYQNEDISVRLVEWIELLGILGASKIFFYELQVHPNISKVLRYYEKLELVESVPLTLAGGQPNLPGLQHMYLARKVNRKRQNEIIPYNDCLYKNLYAYRYVVLLDVDEIIIPVKTASWSELLRGIVRRPKASYNARNVYFFDQDLPASYGEIPHYMHMLQHVYRSSNFTKPLHYVKSFHDTERVVALHNHLPIACIGNCWTYSISPEDAQLQHYRVDCVKSLKKTCGEYHKRIVLDTTIWKFKEQLVQRTVDALSKLGYLQAL